MMEAFLILTKQETIRIIDHPEDMSSIFWTHAPKFTAEQVQKFCQSKNQINAIMLKATGRAQP
jgi:hypothetical protein